LNGETVQQKIAAGGVVKRMLDAGKPPEAVIKALFARCLSREPTGEELAKLLKVIEGEKNRQAALEDVFWALLNAQEFVFNR
jgi:6-phosphogluconate dehydrogenase